MQLNGGAMAVQDRVGFSLRMRKIGFVMNDAVMLFSADLFSFWLNRAMGFISVGIVCDGTERRSGLKIYGRGLSGNQSRDLLPGVWRKSCAVLKNACLAMNAGAVLRPEICWKWKFTP
ncbi:MAG: hypothetical protein ACT4O3_06730 [Elusimicrobiota bacterium]|jgi:hypothetical protein